MADLAAVEQRIADVGRVLQEQANHGLLWSLRSATGSRTDGRGVTAAWLGWRTGLPSDQVLHFLRAMMDIDAVTRSSSGPPHEYGIAPGLSEVVDALSEFAVLSVAQTKGKAARSPMLLPGGTAAAWSVTEFSDEIATLVGEALQTPARVQVVSALLARDVETSASEVAREVDLSLGTIAYHIRFLATRGWLELKRERQVRGAYEHFYSFTAEVHDALVLLQAVVAASSAQPASQGHISPEESSKVAKALKHPMRCRIILALAAADSLATHELAQKLGEATKRVAHQVAELKKLDVVATTGHVVSRYGTPVNRLELVGPIVAVAPVLAATCTGSVHEGSDTSVHEEPPSG